MSQSDDTGSREPADLAGLLAAQAGLDAVQLAAQLWVLLKQWRSSKQLGLSQITMERFNGTGQRRSSTFAMTQRHCSWEKR